MFNLRQTFNKILFLRFGGGCHSFLFILSFSIHAFRITFIQAYNTIVHLHSPRSLSISSLHLCLVGEKPPWGGAEPRFELGPALQQACVLPTLHPIELYAAPHRATLHPTELRCIPLSYAATKLMLWDCPDYILYVWYIPPSSRAHPMSSWSGFPNLH